MAVRPRYARAPLASGALALLVNIGCATSTPSGPPYRAAVVLLASNRETRSTDEPSDWMLGIERGHELTFARYTVDLPTPGAAPGLGAGMLLAPGRAALRLRAEPVAPDEFRDLVLTVTGAPGLVASRPTSSAPADSLPRDGILIYVHGFAAGPEDAVRDAAQIAHDVQFHGPVVVFTWPTRGLFLNYLVDGLNAEWSVPDFVALLELLHAAPGEQRIQIVAHSMGSRIALRGIKEFLARRCLPADLIDNIPELPEPPDQRWFDQLILIAADEDAAIFERSFAAIVGRATERITNYFSTRDWALDLAGHIFRYRRLGSGDCPNLDPQLLDHIESVDVTDVHRGLFGHFYHNESSEVLVDLRRVFDNISAAERSQALPPRLERKVYYRVLPEPRR